MGPPPALVVHDRGRGYKEDAAWNDREREARDLWTRGILDPAAPGVCYFPSISEISHRTELTGSHIERMRKRDEWDKARDRNMAALNIGMMASVEVSDKAVERAERMQASIQQLDDRAVELSQQGMAVAASMIQNMVDTEDQNAGRLHKIATSLEVFHRIAKAAYSPNVDTAGQTINQLNLSVNTVTASEEIVAAVAAVYCDLEAKSRIKEARREAIQGEVEL